METITVSEFVELVDTALGSFDGISVEGEVSEYKLNQGKWVLFKLKDENANVDCFMPKWDLKTEIEDGMMVRAVGRPRLKQWGQFSFNLSDVQPTGEGALKRAYELLQKKLAEEGLFVEERKRKLPRFPERVVLITSRDAAAYTDFIKVLQGRRGGLDVSFIHTLVQGDAAPISLIEALQMANTEQENIDAIILIRGGGSMEDLQAFNDERVVRAVAGSRIPTIVGIGHERDVTLAELAADVRASTPSNAAELLVQTKEEIISDIDQMRLRLIGVLRETVHEAGNAAQMQLRLATVWKSTLQNHTVKVQHLVSVLQRKISGTYQQVNEQVAGLRGAGIRFQRRIEQQGGQTTRGRVVLEQEFNKGIIVTGRRLIQVKRLLQTLSPGNTLARGYSITRNEAGAVVKSLRQVEKGDRMRTRVAEGELFSRVE